MKVRLLDHIVEDGRLKVAMRRPPNDPVPFIKGVIVEMSDASAKKYIDRGQAEAIAEEPSQGAKE